MEIGSAEHAFSSSKLEKHDVLKIDINGKDVAGLTVITVSGSGDSPEISIEEFTDRIQIKSATSNRTILVRKSLPSFQSNS